MLGEDVSAYLVRVHENRFAHHSQFYIGFSPLTTFTNEPDYPHLTEPDIGYRLLALFRFWNIIEYWFPYRHLIDDSWEAVLREFIPRIISVNGREAYELTLLQLVARVDDTHAKLYSALATSLPPKGACQLPVVMRFARRVRARAGEEVPVVWDYSNPTLGPNSGLEIGDVLAELDGQPIRNLIAEWYSYYGGSNRAARLRDIAYLMTRGPCGEVSLEVERGGDTVALRAARVSRGELDFSKTVLGGASDPFRRSRLPEVVDDRSGRRR